jgi:antirestriction protein ArdC
MRNNDVAEKVTADILAALENGDIPWVQPWLNSGVMNPMNITTGKGYRGINTLILYLARKRAGFQFSRWLTFKQAKAAGGTVRKGEHGTGIVFWKFLESPDKADPSKKRTIPLCRWYTVFNVAQCDNLPEDFTSAPETLPVTWENPEIDGFISATGAKISFGGDQACYTPSVDEISMPEKGQFSDMGAYYATAFHELVHWTGHENRCKRQLGQRFGKEIYAAEELVAELGSAFLCAEFGVQGKLQHAGYIQNWIKVLRNDPHAIFAASRLAQEAVDFLTAKSGRAKGSVSPGGVADPGEENVGGSEESGE